MIDVVGKKWIYFLLSALVIIPGILALFLWGLRFSIDFTGGTLLEIRVDWKDEVKDRAQETLRQSFVEKNLPFSSVSESADHTYLVRLAPIGKDQKDGVIEHIRTKANHVEEIRFETIGPTIGQETTRNALKAVFVASVMIVLYIAFAFRGIPKPYSSITFGLAAVVALIHDVLLVVGLFALFGHFWFVEIDSLFITALLTVMGFSVHDTIVVFDRLRENLSVHSSWPFAKVVNESINQTLARSLATSLTVLLTLIALLLFGGETIRWFIVALLVGIASGTYSSIFTAAPLLVLWEQWKRRKAL